jgi:hypothetical protein
MSVWCRTANEAEKERVSMSKPSILPGLAAFLIALPAVAEQPPAGKAPGEDDVAPAPVGLEEKPSQPTAPAAQPAPPAARVTAEAKPAAAAPKTEAAVTLGAAEKGPASQGGVDVGTGGWHMSYHGFFRAPMRVGIGTRTNAMRVPGVSAQNPNGVIPPQSVTTAGGSRALNYADGPQANAWAPSRYSKTTLHSPLIPDDQYLSWQHTNHNPTDWAEMFFTVGSQIAEGTLSIEGYNFTQASFADPNANFGVAQGYVNIHPEMPWDNVRISAKVGAHWDRYGAAGRYDAGEFDTHLFGRTKTMGGTVTQEIDVSGITLTLEEGVGTKKPDPSQANTAKFTMLAHVHGYLQYEGLKIGAHFMSSWAQEEDRDGSGCPGGNYVPNTGAMGNPASAQLEGETMCNYFWPGAGSTGPIYAFGKFAPGAEGNVWLPDGHLNVAGVEAKWDAHPFGLIFLGWSNINAKDALTVGNAIEVLHSDGGGTFKSGVTNNYLDNPRCNGASGDCSSGGNGTVNTIAFQYEFSLMNLLKGLEDGSRFWGEGMDFVAKLYAMYNQVKSKYDPQRDGSWWALNQYGGVTTAYWPLQGDKYSDYHKFKFGGDFYFHALPIMGVGLRADRLMPNSKMQNQSFTIISPRLEFRSTWVTREKITIAYSRYIYDQRDCEVGGQTDLSPTGVAIGKQGSWSNWPVDQNCAQYPNGPKGPDGWGATRLEAYNDWRYRGAPVAGGNPNNTRPDVNVIRLEASMWW